MKRSYSGLANNILKKKSKTQLLEFGDLKKKKKGTASD